MHALMEIITVMCHSYYMRRESESDWLRTALSVFCLAMIWTTGVRFQTRVIFSLPPRYQSLGNSASV